MGSALREPRRVGTLPPRREKNSRTPVRIGGLGDEARNRRDDPADDLQDASDRRDVAIEEAKQAPIGSQRFRDAMTEAKAAEEGVHQAEHEENTKPPLYGRKG